MRFALLCFTLLALPALAETPRDQLTRFEAEARVAANATRGAQFFSVRHGREWSCTSCHTEKPLTKGRHAVTGKMIKPLAPAANAERFADAARTEKWFRRNCNDVLGRECSAGEKADVLAFLIAQK